MQEITLEHFRTLAKSDLHNHAGRGGNPRYIEKCVGSKIALPPEKFADINEMQEWYVQNVRDYTSGVEGQILRWKAGFVQAREDNLKVFAMLFTISEVELVGGMNSFIMILENFHTELCINTIFIPQITFDRGCDAHWAADVIDCIQDYHFFKALDVCNNEFAQPIKNLLPLYRKAKKCGLRLIAHVGEIGTADDVREAVETLELDEVNHGIAAASSPSVMQFLADNRIQLNVCPSSNVMLSIVKDYAHHPIRKLYEAGVKVTINTDDLLIFNKSVSEEYWNLYQTGTLNMDALDDIRRTGLETVRGNIKS